MKPMLKSVYTHTENVNTTTILVAPGENHKLNDHDNNIITILVFNF